MKHYNNRTYNQVVNFFMGIIWVAGLLFAGSDSLYMPWINFFGLLVFIFVSILIAKRCKTAKQQTGTLIYPGFNQKPLTPRAKLLSSNQRHYKRYALSA